MSSVERYRYRPRIALAALSALALMACADGSRRSGQWLDYEPAMVALSGKLTASLEYGPPNYGEEPQTDSRRRVYYLQLAEPINIKENPRSELNATDAEGIERVQVLCSHEICERMLDLLDQQVRVYGSLFEGHAGGHYERVVLAASMVRKEAPSAPEIRTRIFPAAEIVEMAQGGRWGTHEAAGRCRVLIWDDGFEEIRSRIFVQWLAFGSERFKSVAAAGVTWPEENARTVFQATNLRYASQSPDGLCAFEMDIWWDQRGATGIEAAPRTGRLRIAMGKPGELKAMLLPEAP